MAEDESEKPLDPHVSPYLRRPLRTLKEAEQDSDASSPHAMWVPSLLNSFTSPGHRDAASRRRQA